MGETGVGQVLLRILSPRTEVYLVDYFRSSHETHPCVEVPRGKCNKKYISTRNPPQVTLTTGDNKEWREKNPRDD